MPTRAQFASNLLVVVTQPGYTGGTEPQRKSLQQSFYQGWSQIWGAFENKFEQYWNYYKSIVNPGGSDAESMVSWIEAECSEIPPFAGGDD